MPKKFPDLKNIHSVVFDFDGVFTDNKVYIDQNGIESVRCDRADGLGFDFVRFFQKSDLIKAHFFILSKESNPVVLARAKKLKLDCFHGIGDKLQFLKKHVQQVVTKEDGFAGLIYLGNDLNDLPVIRCAGFSVVPSDAHRLVQKEADVILKQKGGEGFVRAFIEKLLGIDKLPKEKLNELISNC